MAATPDHLDRLADLAADAGLDTIAAAVRAYIAGDAPTLDAALGLRAGPGERSWRTRARLARRDAVIRELARHLNRGSTDVAAEIAKRALRYETSRWRFDSRLPEPPADATEIERHLFHLMQHGGCPGARRIRQILATS